MNAMSLEGRREDKNVHIKQNARNGKIEFLRFVFAVIIVIHHSRAFLGDAISPFLGGSLSVEFFFFVSGYLMMATIEKRNKQAMPENIGKETIQYIGKKWIAVLPESITSWILAFGVMSISEGRNIRSMIIRFIDGVWEPLFITMTGLGQRGINGVVWYISAMLICMSILYPLLRKWHDLTIHLLIPFTSMLIFGCFFRNFASARGPTGWLGWTYKGVLRAFAELGIGCLIYYLSKKISSFDFTRLGQCLISVAENALYITVIYFMYLTGANKHDYFFIALMAVAVALTFSGAGIDNRLFNNKIIIWLGRFSVPVYFSHTFWANSLNYYVGEEIGIPKRMLAYFVLAFGSALIIMLVANWLRDYTPAFCKKYSYLFIKKYDHI